MLQRQHLQNGGFESGAFAPGWSDSGELARMVSDTHPYIGDHAALLGDPGYDTNGGCPFGRATIQQTFDVPREGHPMLQVWFRLYSYDTKDFDYFAIDIAPWPVGPAERVFRYGSPYWLNGNLWNSGWIPATIPLDDYVGKRITIRLYNAMTNDDGYYNTWTYVDEVVVVP